MPALNSARAEPSLKEFKGVVATPSDKAGYDIKRWAAQIEKRAAYVVYPSDPQDISIAILFAQSKGFPLAVAGGRHNTGGASSSEGGLVIDMRHMNGIKVDKEKMIVYLQGGCTSLQVDVETMKNVGVCGSVGVVGFATGGGLSFTLGQHGLGVDNIVSATVVLASGEIVIANDEVNPDLFWGIRGGGVNFGVIAELGMRLHIQRPDIYTFECFYSTDKLPEVVAEINSWLPIQQPTEMISVTFVIDSVTRKPAVRIGGFGDFNQEEGERIWSRFFNLGALRPALSRSVSRTGRVSRRGSVRHKILNTGVHFNKFDYDTVRRAFDQWVDLTLKAPLSSVMFQFHHYQKLASVPVSATAFAHRSLDKTAMICAVWKDDNFTPHAGEWAESLKACISSSSTDSAQQSLGYSCFADLYSGENATDTNAREIFGPNYARLQEVKRKYDPDMLFNKWFCIRPSIA
ncbi:hypothetical protein FRB93_003674 [Tulasnella sp. JGI-2019a]|nr:hypothetical protein FRB93_003674 [Tulasnella sp. JGI-2019a]